VTLDTLHESNLLTQVLVERFIFLLKFKLCIANANHGSNRFTSIGPMTTELFKCAISPGSVLFHPASVLFFCFRHCWYFHNIPYFTMEDFYSVNFKYGISINTVCKI